MTESLAEFRRRLAESRLISLAAGAADGLSYPLALLLAAPIIVHLSNSATYSRLAFVVLLSSVGSLFNIVGSQGIIYSIARAHLTTADRSRILTATLILVGVGLGVFAIALPVIKEMSGAARIFSPQNDWRAMVVAWPLCLLVSVDGVFGGLLKARNLVVLTAPIEVAKLVGIVCALWMVSRLGSWEIDAYCLMCAAALSVAAKGALAFTVAGVRPSGIRGALLRLRDVTRINSWQWLLLLSTFLFQQADRLIIASRLGAAEFAMYNFYWQATFVIHAASATGLISILPLATARASAVPRAELKPIYFRDLRFGVGVSSLLVAAILITAGAAIGLRLVPAELLAGEHAFFIMVFAAYLAALAIIPYYYMVAFGRLGTVAVINVTGAAFAFITALCLAKNFGVTGLALSKLWSGLTLLCYWLCYREFKRDSGASSSGRVRDVGA